MKIKSEKKIFDIEDTGRHLKVSKNMIYRYVEDGRLVPLRRDKRKRGDQLFFSLKDLKAFQRPKRGRPKSQCA
jgi:hypothetical protein